MSTTTHNHTVQSYLFFDGRCEEALQYYRQALGAEVEMLMRFKDSPEPAQCGSGSGDKVMHASFRIGGTTVMASDGRCEGKPNFQGFALALSVPTEAEADRRFGALAKGGQVQMPLAKTFFSPRFGMVTDRFGVMWMVIVPAAEATVPQSKEPRHDTVEATVH
jgi:PhnB protein